MCVRCSWLRVVACCLILLRVVVCVDVLLHVMCCCLLLCAVSLYLFRGCCFVSCVVFASSAGIMEDGWMAGWMMEAGRCMWCVRACVRACVCVCVCVCV